MMFTFCGVLAGLKALPGFWIFMYRVNPFTYIIESSMGTSLGNAPMFCATNGKEGYLADPKATECMYCAVSNTNQFLASVSISYGNRWRDFGIMWAFCIFNLCIAFLFYWLARVPKNKKVKKD
ncbi:ABC transporter CDR4 [Fusarium pseudocircinatum]|uniref:ABC transporter CDR4 n=1 Tax=Fusarium pseudocircinatum TaxID=56676 RepID=A0A8H5P116_9HYPO|nr:ABC transporter CDR4 [Fusarium pseudocircinatum]